MTPGLGTRLNTIATALRQVVIPALPPDEVLAIEQATLCVGHLAILNEQYSHLADYAAICLTDLVGLADDLVVAARGGPETSAAADALRHVLDEVRSAPTNPASATHDNRNSIATAVNRLVRASSEDGHPSFRVDSQRLIVARGARQSHRDRAWFRGSGIDPDSATLPSIPDLVSAPLEGPPYYLADNRKVQP